MRFNLSWEETLAWLREESPDRLEELWTKADETRREAVGDIVHLRGLIEISNRCSRRCAYCGLSADNSGLVRYRMELGEILEAARDAVRFGYGTVVLQAGEDFGLSGEWIAELVSQIKKETPLAVTLSLGERTEPELELWRKSGADRYLLRFETSDPGLFRAIHPARAGGPQSRVPLLRFLKQLGYEVGSGIMIGLTGQSYYSVAQDLQAFRGLDLDMIGIGPFLPHPQTPLGRGEFRPFLAPEEQVPNTELMVYKLIALTRLTCPEANIPSTTALATLNRVNGRELGLQRGANVIMPNLTPQKYRKLYEIYPHKACIQDSASTCYGCLQTRISRLGRTLSSGPGGRRRQSTGERQSRTGHLTFAQVPQSQKVPTPA